MAIIQDSVKILICGFAGAGKTTFLEKLRVNSGKYHKFSFYDLDDEIARNWQVLPIELGSKINSVGEAFFRETERELLLSLLIKKESMLIALGGGTLSNELILEFSKINEKILMVFINTPFEVCLNHIKNDPNRLLYTKSEIELKQIYQDRLLLYKKSNLIIDQSDVNLIDGLETLVHNLS